MPRLHVAAVMFAGLLGSPAAAQSTQHALVYARDPTQTPQPELAPLPLRAEAQALRHPWLSAHSCVDAGARDSRGHRRCSIVESARPDAQGHFAAAPAPANATASAADPFAEQMLFVHGGRMLQFFADLGLEPQRAGAPLQLIANVRLPAPEQLLPWRDASFLRAGQDAGPLAAIHAHSGPAVYFGQAGDVRVAYDSAAIRHEVAHATLAAWLPSAAWFIDAHGTSNAPAAIAEGLADYFAAALAEDPRVGAHADQRLTRNLNTHLTCPAALSGTAHQDGLLLASALWAARKELGPGLDRALATALRKLHAPATLSFEQLLQAALAALGPQRAAAAKIFRERGLLPACQRVAKLDPLQSFSGASGKLIVPGAEPARPLASSVLQLKAEVPTATKQIELRMRAGCAQPTDAQHFEPALLVSPKPIRWTEAGAHNATLVSATQRSTASELHFVLPPLDARTLYLQVVNRGQRPGWYDAVRVIFRR